MPKSKVQAKDKQPNPFLTDKTDALWEKLDENGAHVSKEELLRRVLDIKRKRKK